MLLSKYQISEKSLVSRKIILDECNEVKESISDGMCVALTAIVKEMWSEKVKVVKTSPRSQRSYFYLNLARKTPQQKCNN